MTTSQLIQSCSHTLSYAGAPNVTELTFDIESRTLTCTSTGGPATTVTWTKDGAVITPNTTHQQTQMIVDTVGGIYQNTLTIAQSVTGDNLYGLYSCMVENSKGSSNRTASFGYGKTVWLEIFILLKLSTVTLAVDNVLTTMWQMIQTDLHQPINTHTTIELNLLV